MTNNHISFINSAADQILEANPHWSTLTGRPALLFAVNRFCEDQPYPVPTVTRQRIRNRIELTLEDGK